MINPVSNPVFTAARGCLVEINGWRADIQTELPLLRLGLCTVTPVDLKNAHEAAELMPRDMDDADSCGDPVLFDLAIRYHEWRNDANHAPWPDTPAPMTDHRIDTLYAVRSWCERIASEERGEPVIIFSERRDTRNSYVWCWWASEEEQKRRAEGIPRAPLFKDVLPP